MIKRIPLAGVATLLALAPAAHAEKLTYGSDLSSRATITESHPRDWSAFRPGEAAPAQGEVTQISVRGTVLKPDNDAAYQGRYPDFVFHIVVLRPDGNGRYTSIVSTEPLPFPFGGDAQQITTYDLQAYAARICVQKGDVVALATSGGFGNSSAQFGGFPDDYYADGYPVQMFSRDASSNYEIYEVPADQETGDLGRTFKTDTRSNQELLMRTTIGTAEDARFTCRTDAQQQQHLPNPGTPATPTTTAPVAPPSSLIGPAKVAKASRAPKIRRLKVNIHVACPGNKPCGGMLSLSNRSRTYGSAAFLLKPGTKKAIPVALNSAALRQIKKGRGKVTVKASLANQDGSKTYRRLVIKRA